MEVPVIPSHRPRFSMPREPARRIATWSLLMVAGTGIAVIVGGVVGTFLGFVVFDLEEQELLSQAGAWGYLAGFVLLGLMVIPALVGIVLGVRARRLGERRLGTTGIVANAVIAAYLLVPGVTTLLFG